MLSNDRTNPASIPDRGSDLIIVSTVFLAITTAFFLTRLIFRWRTKQPGWDDLMAALAYITLVVQTSFGYAAAHYGFGKHRSDIPATFTKAMFYFYIYQICYKLIGGFTKLNFCFLYLRIFSFKNFQKLVIANAVIIGLGSFAFTIGTVFQCVPVRKNWDRRVDGFCISNMAFWYSHAAFNTFMDIAVYLLPIPLIRTLHMASRTKAGLIAIFALGAFTIAASIVRMLMLRDSANSTQDPTWGSMKALIWTEVEANTAVICCCLPALRTLFVQLWRRVLGKQGPETPTNTNDGGTRSGTRKEGTVRTEQAARPTRSRFLGNFTEAKFTPPETQHDLERVLKPGRAWLPGWNQHKAESPQASEEELIRVEEGHGAVLGSTAPRLDLGQIYKTMDVHVESNRDSQSPYRSGEAEQQLSLSEILNDR